MTLRCPPCQAGRRELLLNDHGGLLAGLMGELLQERDNRPVTLSE